MFILFFMLFYISAYQCASASSLSTLSSSGSESISEDFPLVSDMTLPTEPAMIHQLLLQSFEELDYADNEIEFRNSQERVFMCLRAGIHIDTPNEAGKTALYTAFENENIELATLCIRHGADLDKSVGNSTPRKLAKSKNLLVGKVLGAVRIQQSQQQRWYAYWKPILDTYKILDNTAEAMEKYAWHIREFQTTLAGILQFHDQQKWLLHISINTVLNPETQETLLFHACLLDAEKEVQQLLFYGADPNRAYHNGKTPLFVVCQKGNVNIFRMLLDYNANPAVIDSRHHTPLLTACLQGDTEIISDLLTHEGVDVNHQNIWGESPVSEACASGNLSVLKLLYNAGADLRSPDHYQGNTPLHWACSTHKSNIAEYLIKKHGADVNGRNNLRQTPLFVTCDMFFQTRALTYNPVVGSYRDSEDSEETPTETEESPYTLIRLLIKYGAEVNLYDQEGNSPLYVLCGMNDPHVLTGVNLLIRAGAHVLHTNKQGRNALHAAALSSNIPVLQKLIEEGVSPNTQDFTGNTPLLLACGSGKLKSIIFLLNQIGIDVSLRNNHNVSPKGALKRHINLYQEVLRNEQDTRVRLHLRDHILRGERILTMIREKERENLCGGLSNICVIQ